MASCSSTLAQPIPVPRLSANIPEAELDGLFDKLVTDTRLPFAGLVVFDRTGILYSRATPGFRPDEPVAVASASKWIFAALVMTAVERGELALADPVEKFIPEAPPALKRATLSQLLGHRSGMAGRYTADMGPMQSLEQAALELASQPMAAAPGSRFAYGGASMQVAALMLERAAKQSFATLFNARIARPLGFTDSRFGSPRTWGSGDVPMVGGGLSISFVDYRRFLEAMLADGAPILRPESVAAIETDGVAGLSMAAGGQAVPDARGYGLGVWCAHIAPDGRCGHVSSAGAFGAYPWIDRRTGRAGLFLTRSRLADVRTGIFAIRDASAAISQ